MDRPEQSSIWGIVAGLLVALALMTVMSVGCSLVLDLDECSKDSDCTTQEKPRCDDGICVPPQ